MAIVSNIFPQSMKQVDSSKTKESIESITDYIHYMCERISYGNGNVYKAAVNADEELRKELEEEIQSISDSLTELTKVVSTNTANIKTNTGNISTNTSSIGTLKSTYETLSGTVGTLSSTVNTINSTTIPAINQTIKDMKDENVKGSLAARIAALEEKI